MYTLEQLLSFVTVAEELHYGRAAARLSMTQPPLSRRIQLLERELGVELFDRSGRTVKLTPTGRAFLPDARRVLNLSQEAAQSARRARRGEEGVVTIGFTAATAYSFLEHVLTAAAADLPQIELVLREMVSAAQIDALLAGELDVGLVRPPATGADITSERLYQEPLLAALPVDHPMALRESDPTVTDFDGEPFVAYSPSEGRYFYELLVGLFRLAEVQPQYVQYLSQGHTILAMVKAGLGVAIVPAALAALRLRGVVLRPVRGIDPDPVKLDMTWRHSNDNPALAALLSLIRKVADSTQN